MTGRVLCQSSHCRSDEKGGPRQVEPKRPLCRWCANSIAGNLEAIALMWPDLEDQLAVSRGPEDRVSGSTTHGMMIHEKVSDAIHTVSDWAWFLVRTIVDETHDAKLPIKQDVATVLAWVARWHTVRLTYHEDEDLAVAIVNDAADYRALVYRRAYPSIVKRVEIPGRCIALNEQTGERCAGTLFALVRVDSSLLPSEICCDLDEAHRIPASQWSAYGKKIQAIAKAQLGDY